jgi:hypothetical protein
MSLWLVLTLGAVWFALCALALAICVAAARGDRDEARLMAAERQPRAARGVGRLRSLGFRRTRRGVPAGRAERNVRG